MRRHRDPPLGGRLQPVLGDPHVVVVEAHQVVEADPDRHVADIWA